MPQGGIGHAEVEIDDAALMLAAALPPEYPPTSSLIHLRRPPRPHPPFRPPAPQRGTHRGSGRPGHLRAGEHQRRGHGPQPSRSRVPDLRDAPERRWARGRDSRNVRFFDFDHPEGGLNEFMVTTQSRVRRGSERDGPEDDERLVIPDLVPCHAVYKSPIQMFMAVFLPC